MGERMSGHTRVGLMVGGLALAAALGGCDGVTDPPAFDEAVEVIYDFNDGKQGWEGGFAHYGVGRSEDMGLTQGIETLPSGFEGEGFHLGGRNKSDDLWMYITRGVDGFEPGRAYQVLLAVRFLSAAPRDCVGIGGPPGESVFLKAGATDIRPEPVEEDDYWYMNVDKGNQLTDGAAAELIGDVATSNQDCHEWIWEELEHGSREGRTVTADEEGRIWLLIGTDSGFEGRTDLFYTEVEAVFIPL